MPKKVIAYNLENTALAALCDSKYDAQRDILQPGLKTDIAIMTALSPAVCKASLTVLIADSYTEERKEYGELSYYAYSMLDNIRVYNLEESAENAFKGLPDGCSEDYKPLVCFESSSDDIIPISLLDDGRVVSFIKMLNEGYLIVLPSITDYEKLGQIIQKIEKNYQRYIPSEEGTKANLPLKLKRLLEKRCDIKSKADSQLKDIDDEVENTFPEYIFLSGLVNRNDELFTSSAKLFLNSIGIIPSDSPDMMALPDGSLLIVQCISASAFSCNTSSLSSRIRGLRKKNKDAVLHALLVVNHQKYLSPEERRVPFSDLEAEAAKASGITITSSSDLIRVYENMKEGIITKDYILSSLLEDGYADFSFPSERLIGVISRVSSQDDHVCRFTLDNRSIRKGMKIIIEDKNGSYRTSRITALAVGRVQMADVMDGEVTVTFDSPVSSGEHLYFC